MMQAGKYLAHPISVAAGTTKAGKDYHAVVFETLETGETIEWRGYWSGGAAKITEESLLLCGWDGDERIDTSREVEIVVEPDEWEGKTYMRVRYVNKPGGVKMAAPQTPTEKASFAARIKAKRAELAALRGETSSATPSKPTPSQRVAAAMAKGSANGNDDLPF